MFNRLLVTATFRCGLNRPQDITKPILERCQRHLFLYRKEDGKPLTTRSQHTRITPLRADFKWLARNNHILYKPASELELPRLERRLPAPTSRRSRRTGRASVSSRQPCDISRFTEIADIGGVARVRPA